MTMLQWRAELWYSDALLVETTVTARDLRDATEAAWLHWRALDRPGMLELTDRVAVRLLRVAPPTGG